MESTHAPIDVKGIVKQFAKAVQEKNFDLIGSLLADDGEYHTQDAGLTTLDDSTKPAFIDWLRLQPFLLYCNISTNFD